MVKNNTLIIVESNGKCKKIEKYTGHKCIASFGHVYALKPSLDWFNPNGLINATTFTSINPSPFH